jgi:hypothetical protein
MPTAPLIWLILSAYYIYLFIYLKADYAAAGNTGQKTATNVYPVKNKQ